MPPYLLTPGAFRVAAFLLDGHIGCCTYTDTPCDLSRYSNACGLSEFKWRVAALEPRPAAVWETCLARVRRCGEAGW